MNRGHAGNRYSDGRRQGGGYQSNNSRRSGGGGGGFTNGRAREQSNNYRAASSSRSRSNPRNNGQIDDNDDSAPPDTEPALRVLSFFEQGSRIAFACYNEEENEIVFEDEYANNGADTERICRSVLVATRPNLILVSNKVLTNAPLLECLTTMPLGSDGSDDGANISTNTAPAATVGHSDNTDAEQPANANGAGSSQNNTRTAASTIPYQLLKSSAFEPRSCRSVILQKLRVLTLMKRPMTEDYSSHDYNNYNASTMSSAQPPSNFHSLASVINFDSCLLYTSPSPRDLSTSRMPSSA